MEYIHDQFAYPPQPSQQQMLYHPGPYQVYGAHAQQQLDDFYMTYGHRPDFIPHGPPYHEEYEDVGEAPTRPRLTKEQVTILEAQFQANHKPNSMVKRQLAMRTNLSLPRVAVSPSQVRIEVDADKVQNWFQNRRAKAKQQKKQEEFENAHFSGGNDGTYQDRSADDSAMVKDEDDQSDDDDYLSGRPMTSEADDASKEAAWASLQRALNAAKGPQPSQQQHSQSQLHHSMPPPMRQHESTTAAPFVGTPRARPQIPQPQTFARKSWADAWASHQVFQDQSFDFGFDTQTTQPDFQHSAPTSHSSQSQIQETCLVSPDSWHDALPTPRGLTHDSLAGQHDFQPPDLPLPAYPHSRRGSAADSLTNNFDAFALATESPHALTTPTTANPISQPEGHLDLAARRNRPRPAALTSASLRSRSYGAMTSISPTFRPGMTPGPPIRHVKSTGHSLNARYSGIRKPSSAQRSPMNISTFAEAEALNRLMAEQAAAAQAPAPRTDTTGPLMSPDHLPAHSHAHFDYVANSLTHHVGHASQYQLPTTQHLTLMTASPPVTPFATEFDPSHGGFAMPPVSAPPQYASFPDFTPPYSAGPLTNSSWSDAPLTSPDIPNFPPVTYIPSLGHPFERHSVAGHFQEFILPSDLKQEMGPMSATIEQKKTDFFIQEFPNQREEHAHIARQLGHTKPKSYIFANTAPSDYDHS